MRKPLGTLLVIFGVIVICFVLYANSKYKNQTRIFSSYSLLMSSWDSYKKQFISSEGRVIDPSQQNVTTSEAQAYAMLRAVWTDDKTTFDKVYTFTSSQMKRPSDHLFGWRYGKMPEGKYGFLPGGGNNSATDADSDIAFSLLLAAKRWKDPSYKNNAIPLIQDIWKYETATTNSGKRYILAGNWAQDQQKLIINVSYFAPYEWRAFAKVDKKDDWLSLLTPAYQLLTTAGTTPLDKPQAVGLPPDWLAMDRQNDSLTPANVSNLTTNYSFDAMRTPWRIALDYRWYKDEQAYTYLKNSYQFLAQEYKYNQTLVSTYTHDGKRLTGQEDPAMYATILSYFTIVDPSMASQLYQNKIIRLYSNDQNTFDSNLAYYEQNWLWFGVAYYNNFLSNFGL